ncbi:hypothetical protein [Anaplasma capra]|uniref:hypothetical protein n=1 Tax=Anaplasma capra TaxID=1562740 RepID=UPI0021D56B15|nr:hypothetical protein [Anaplasma capra]MCU7611867.1 hypothetical protein [Anaplasma capra]MCU7612657.1 hypothetical protein [Anaplasma capra]
MFIWKGDRKSVLRRRCILQVVALAILGVLCFALRHVYDNMARHREVENRLQLSIARMSAAIQSVREHETQLNNNFSVWREMLDTHVYSSDGGRGDGGLQSVIRNLCKQHKVIIEELTVSDPIDMSDDYKKRYTRVIRSTIRMRFKALTDKHAIMLLHAIKYDIPGFISVKLIEMAKEREITQEVAASLRHGSVIPTVKGEIVLNVYGIHGRHL